MLNDCCNQSIRMLWIILIVLALLGACWQSAPDMLVSDLQVNVCAADSNWLGDKLQVTQDIHIPANLCADTLTLTLSNVSIGNFIFIPETSQNLVFPMLRVYVNYGQQSDFLFDQQSLRIPIHDTVHTVSVQYEYCCFDMHMRLDGDGTKTLFCWSGFDPSWHSWYFTADSMHLRNVSVQVPDSLLLFTNCDYRKEHSTYNLSTCGKEYVELYVLHPDKYDARSTRVADTELNIYLQKTLRLNTTAKTTPTSNLQALLESTEDLSPAMVEHRVALAARWLQALHDFFQDQKHRNITLADGLYRNERNFWAHAVHNHNGTAYIYADTLAWHDHTIMHELTHRFMPQCTYADEWEYLFSESMVEYIAYVLYFDYQYNVIDSTLTHLYAELSPEQHTMSLSQITENYLVADPRQSTSPVIYIKIPYLMHQLAKQTGERQFVETLRLYLHHVDTSGEAYNLCGFMRFLKAHGVSDDDGQCFIEQL